ncbi:ABC transporter ATP-binding protein [Rhizobium sp. IBUN]|uniref:ABC transporter ATP-binding protein n=1 Tax=Rhizobium sp. IBUN TaxID=1042326 RepID=UPI00040650DA|nr:ABC transporter ATP-binding protein [Rhizobium sp. IBUN]
MSSLEGEQDLILRGVSKRYGHLQVLQPTELHVRSGEFLTIVGSSGSGKTTLLRMIAGFTNNTSGEILFQGRDITNVPTHKRPFNTVFQDYALFPHMTVAENIGYGPMIRRQPREAIARKVNEALSIVGLQKMIDRMPSQLSGGQKQRVALARALVCEPKVLLLDEPLSALDAEMRYQMQTFLKDLQRRVDTTFILVTHDQEEAITMSDRIAVMSAGRIEQVGDHREVYYAPKTPFVASFFGDTNLIAGTLTPDGGLQTPLGLLADVAARGPRKGKVIASLRPEAIQLSAAGRRDAGIQREGERICISARIQRTIFAGPLTRVVATCDDHPEIEFLVKVTSGDLPVSSVPGTSVRLRFSAKDLAIVPVDGDEAASAPGHLKLVAASEGAR